MEDTVIFPSPTWFQPTGLAVSSDGWLIYGGPSKSLCVLKPLNKSVQKDQCYHTRVLSRAHGEKIVSIDISPEWPEKRSVVAGSADGVVKQWSFTEVNKSIKIKFDQSHDIHQNENEEVVGVGYSNEVYVITVGSFGNIVKWDVSSNVVKTYDKFLKIFKPTCMACSPHLLLNVAVGTKQGVVFVLDLNGNGNIIYKVRGQNEETISVSWCPQYEVLVKKALEVSDKKSHLADRLAKIRLEGTEEEKLNKSGITKDLPDDSFDNSIVQEDDMFDIYKDHEEDEFGHKKYKPELIRVKVKEEKEEESDFLAECLKLKEDLLKRKNAPEESIESLVNAFDKAQVDEPSATEIQKQTDVNALEKLDEASSQNEKVDEASSDIEKLDEASSHTHKHLLASIGKLGSVRIWSKSGKLVASCAVSTSGYKNQKNKSPAWATLLWYKADVLIIADGKNQLVQCNPLKLDSKNKLHWKVEHTLHKRGLFSISTNAPRVQNVKNETSGEKSKDKSKDSSEDKKKVSDLKQEDWVVWTASQDRNLVCYSMETHEAIAQYNSCGGYIYVVDPCPYDARKFAICVGDGAVRVWEADTVEEDNTKLSKGSVHTYWQNVQGKVLTVAWHPTKENLLAFATAESRVGLIETGGKTEKAARTLAQALRGGVYALCWGRGDWLYACAGGELVQYDTSDTSADPTPIAVEVEGRKWELSSVLYQPRGVLVGSQAGGVALLDSSTHQPLAATFVFSKMIHQMDWHPQQTSASSEESPYRNLIAVSSLDKQNAVAILEYDDKGEGPKLHTWKMLSGHKGPVLEVAWNPHREQYLLSTSQDATVRVWDVIEGVCTSIYGGHTHMAIGAAWSTFPALAGTVVSGGADCSLRVWDMGHYPADSYEEIKHEVAKKDKKKKKGNKPEETIKPEESTTATELTSENIPKAQKKFLLSTISRQMYPMNALKIRKMAEKLLNISEHVNGDADELEIGLDFIKTFGNTNDINAVLDMEMEQHLKVQRLQPWMILSVFRGDMAAMISAASERDLLCPFLVSLAPCVSFKYWKDTMQLYLAQIDRMVAKGDADKLSLSRDYGGVIYRKAALLLSVHDVRGAVDVLIEAKLYHEAYLLSRTRHMDSIAEETLKKWAEFNTLSGMFPMAAFCYIGLRDPYQAAVELAKLNSPEYLSLSADLAKMAGQVTFAEHIEDKLQKTQLNNTDENEDLKPLPTRAELIAEETKQTLNGVEESSCQ